MVLLDSISLFFDEAPLLKGEPLENLLKLNFCKYQLQDPIGQAESEYSAPWLWNLPEVFRKKLNAYSQYYFYEINKQNALADAVRYNFSNGMQISAKEILRHPLQGSVPQDLLPQEAPANAGSWPLPWPLLQSSGGIFASQTLLEIEAIIQALLDRVATRHRQGKLELYLQTRSPRQGALRITSLELDPVNEVNWRVDFAEKKDLHTEFKLMSLRQPAKSAEFLNPEPLHFYQSFALNAKAGILLVHPWYQEFRQLQATLSEMDDSLFLANGKGGAGFEVSGELECKAVLKYLRARTIPLSLAGESVILGAQQSQTEIHLDENGGFYVQQDARIKGQKQLVRKGWTSQSVLFLQILSQGLPFLLKAEAKDIASRFSPKREWDLRLLKHLGILQYLTLEILSCCYEGSLTDGTEVQRKNLFSKVQPNIQKLLLANSDAFLAREMPLTALCSKAVLACFEDFVNVVFKALVSSEYFYTEQGEVIMEGVAVREFRLIYELLKNIALTSNGESFKKSRTPFLAKISAGKFSQVKEMATARFHFPAGENESKKGASLQSTLESLQSLVVYDFKIYYKGQPIQALQDDEFQVDFILKSGLDDEGERKLFNWFELNPKFFLRGEEVDPEHLQSLGGGGVIEYKGKLFLVPKKQMPSLRRLEHFWLKLQKGKVETQRKKNGETIYRLPRSQTLELLALRASGVDIRGYNGQNEEWLDLCRFYDNLGSFDPGRKVPQSTRFILKPYQVAGVHWLQDLYRLRLGALLADDMGLGKTLQTLCFLDDLRAKGEMGQVLIVMPSSLVFNWQSEIEKFTPELPVKVFSSRGMDAIAKALEAKEEMVLLITYGLLLEHEQVLNQYKWKVLIFDEAQNLKNITTKRTSAARSLTAQFRICLTGTPMENHYGEFYSLLDLLVPGSLGKIENFRRQFVNTDLVTREEMEDLKLKIKPLLLRRTKKEILDQLPEKQETKVSIAFEEQQKEIYRDIALAYNQKIQEAMQGPEGEQSAASVQLQMLTALLRLRQACSDPSGLPNVRYEKVPPKLETLLESISEIIESGESALVFTQFLQTLERTAKVLKAAGVPVFVIHGGVSTTQRQKVLAEFDHFVGGAVLLMTLKTGGVGLNLTKASYVFHIEPWWNPSVENQATDRAHRMGQLRRVQVFKYIMHESLEEKIEVLKGRKERKFQSLFSDSENEIETGTGSQGLSKQDFDLLLGLK